MVADVEVADREAEDCDVGGGVGEIGGGQPLVDRGDVHAPLFAP